MLNQFMLFVVSVLNLLVGSASSQKPGKTFLEGWGWNANHQVTACLIAVGLRDVDELLDEYWEQWISCMALGNRRNTAK
jgi:hypothetical protein